MLTNKQQEKMDEKFAKAEVIPPYVEKPRLPKAGVIKEVQVSVEARLTSDFQRYSNGTVLMGFAGGTFTLDNGTKGRITISAGGDSIEVTIGEKDSRSWAIKLNALVEAAIEADELYQKEVL